MCSPPVTEINEINAINEILQKESAVMLILKLSIYTGLSFHNTITVEFLFIN